MDDRSGVGRNAVALPTSGGAGTNVTDGFQADLRRGTGSYIIIISAPPGRGGLHPDVRLQYNSANGFGPAGIGWSFEPPELVRRLDVGTPTFLPEDDVFTFQDEELLDVGGGCYRCRTERN